MNHDFLVEVTARVISEFSQYEEKVAAEQNQTTKAIYKRALETRFSQLVEFHKLVVELDLDISKYRECLNLDDDYLDQYKARCQQILT